MAWLCIWAALAICWVRKRHCSRLSPIVSIPLLISVFPYSPSCFSLSPFLRFYLIALAPPYVSISNLSLRPFPLSPDFPLSQVSSHSPSSLSPTLPYLSPPLYLPLSPSLSPNLSPPPSLLPLPLPLTPSSHLTSHLPRSTSRVLRRPDRRMALHCCSSAACLSLTLTARPAGLLAAPFLAGRIVVSVETRCSGSDPSDAPHSARSSPHPGAAYVCTYTTCRGRQYRRRCSSAPLSLAAASPTPHLSDVASGVQSAALLSTRVRCSLYMQSAIPSAVRGTV